MPFSTQSRGKANGSRPSVSSSQDSSSISSSSGTNLDTAHYPELRPLPQSHAPMACVDPAFAVPFDMSILTISHKRDHNSVKAVIVGGGISGLATAIMMDMAGMEYEILERSTGKEPITAAAIVLGPPVLRLMEQMDLLAQIERVSKPVSGITIVDGECRRMGRVEGMEKERYGYNVIIIGHQDLHRILLERVSKSHLHRGKMVVETLQNPNGVSCKCSDGSTYYGDIIIGADGAHSQTRERMYVQLKEQGKLPEADMEASLFDHVAIGGISDPLDRNIYTTCQDPASEFQVIYIKEAPYTLWYLPMTENRVAWGISHHQPPKIRHHPYSNSLSTPPPSHGSSYDLAPPSHDRSKPVTPPLSRSHSQTKIYDDWCVPAKIDFEIQFKDLLDAHCAIGPGTVRDFVAHTPKKSLIMVDLEERLYRTWYHGRIVLIGDACHQHLAIGGQGAVQSLLDSVCLVNLLYDMEYNTPNEIAKAFKRYQTKRYSLAKASVEEASQMTSIFYGQGFRAGIIRKFMFNSVWSFNMKNDKLNNNRPQLSFLPFVEDRGQCKANRQKISSRLSGHKTFTM
ncbi:hypothetical protein BGZ50_007894 [Haplosporangium sp. Z 11]|nr:hypothetical protein BGZ50_007894 [Haplosporangium sp. Z 11]